MNLPPDLPTGPMAPLPPRPGALADVLAGARARRNRRLAALGGSVTVLLLALSIPLVLRDGDGGPAQKVQTADDDREDAVASTTTSTSVVEVADEGTDDTVPATTTTTTAPVATEWLEEYDLASPQWLVGRAIDPDGKPVRGVLVYSGLGELGIPRPLATTDELGYYQIPCPDQAVVLAGSQINTYAGEHSTNQNWAPITLQRPGGGPLQGACGQGAPLVTDLQYGGVIEGVVVGMNETSSGAIYAAVDMPWPGSTNQGMPVPYHVEAFIWDGTFKLLGLPPGDVTLYRAKSSGGSGPLEWVTDVVHVESGEITRVELQAPPRDPSYTP